jgi:hypothetical protein
VDDFPRYVENVENGKREKFPISTLVVVVVVVASGGNGSAAAIVAIKKIVKSTECKVQSKRQKKIGSRSSLVKGKRLQNIVI